MSDIAIKVENISKKYQIGENKTYPTLRDKLMELPNRLFKGPKKNKEFWALKDVSFEVKKGEVVGIIGRNGAGKSTMLKILARITEPTSGKITMYGRVASMLEVGTGFNPELTGRENIYLNGSIIGMKKTEIEQRFNDIVAFSGVDKFLDTPVKHYSSGMYVRLAFAVSAHLDADILLVDEVLAVGDAEFQKKCLGKMSDIADSGRTIIFVSHNINAIRKICNKILLVSEGAVISNKLKEEALNLYENLGLMGKDVDKELKSSDGSVILSSPIWINKNGNKVSKYNLGENPTLKFLVEFKRPQVNLIFGVGLDDLAGNRILTSHHIDDIKTIFPSTFKGRAEIISSLDMTNLAPGKYWLTFGIKDKTNKTIIYSEHEISLVINQGEQIKDGSGGLLWHTGSWGYHELKSK